MNLSLFTDNQLVALEVGVVVPLVGAIVEGRGHGRGFKGAVDVLFLDLSGGYTGISSFSE